MLFVGYFYCNCFAFSNAMTIRRRVIIVLSFSNYIFYHNINPLNKVFTTLHRFTYFL